MTLAPINTLDRNYAKAYDSGMASPDLPLERELATGNHQRDGAAGNVAGGARQEDGHPCTSPERVVEREPAEGGDRADHQRRDEGAGDEGRVGQVIRSDNLDVPPLGDDPRGFVVEWTAAVCSRTPNKEERRKLMNRKWQREYYHRHRDGKVKTRNITKKAIRHGLIQRADACEDCGATTGVQTHHNDYSDPLAVSFLCEACHQKKHFIRAPIPTPSPSASKGER